MVKRARAVGGKKWWLCIVRFFWSLVMLGFSWHAKTEKANNGLSCPSWPRAHASWIQTRKRNNIVVRDNLDGDTVFFGVVLSRLLRQKKGGLELRVWVSVKVEVIEDST